MQGTEIYHYNAKNQLTHIQSGADTLRYLYDKQGNLLEEQGKANRKQYAYDTANRQTGIILAEADGANERFLQSNRYDGEGLRYETEENGKIIRFLFDRGELAQEKQEEEEISYVRGHQPISLSRSGKDRNYFVQDEMGSTLFLLDQDHEIRKTYRYDAFGNLLKETGDIPNRLTYTGQIYDGAAIQYYLRARFYNPAIGRFMQEDTYRGDGLNLYAYCANNPVIYYDPSGHLGFCPKGATEPAYDESGEALDWDAVVSRQGGTRQEHVSLHESNDLSKPSHGVFYGDSVSTINDAWENRGNGYMITEGNTDLYIIPYPNAGYAGGYGGQGNNLNYVTIVTQQGTNNIITGFPGNGYKYKLKGIIGGN